MVCLIVREVGDVTFYLKFFLIHLTTFGDSSLPSILKEKAIWLVAICQKASVLTKTIVTGMFLTVLAWRVPENFQNKDHSSWAHFYEVPDFQHSSSHLSRGHRAGVCLCWQRHIMVCVCAHWGTMIPSNMLPLLLRFIISDIFQRDSYLYSGR
jgi:hypothetical protein